MHSPTAEYLTALRFDYPQAATLRVLGEYQGKQQLYAAQSPEALKGLRQIARYLDAMALIHESAAHMPFINWARNDHSRRGRQPRDSRQSHPRNIADSLIAQEDSRHV